jgi:hypothetical protein
MVIKTERSQKKKKRKKCPRTIRVESVDDDVSRSEKCLQRSEIAGAFGGNAVEGRGRGRGSAVC